MITNRLGLPQAIVNAVANDPYTKGASDISVTQLIAPPLPRKLRMNAEVSEDAADRIWSLVGQVGHGIVERAYPEAYTEAAKNMTPAEAHTSFGVVAERRLFTECGGWTVSGQFDVIEGGCLQDYKFTTVWSVIGDEPKPEWVAQLNLLRLLAIRSGIPINSLRIITILRDWSKGKSKSAGYPSQQVVPVEIPVWSVKKTEEYMEERVRVHQDQNPPICTNEERWTKPDVFAVVKEGRKSAVKLHTDLDEATAHLSTLDAKHSITRRPGEHIRCMSYCNVAHLCPAMQEGVPF